MRSILLTSKGVSAVSRKRERKEDYDGAPPYRYNIVVTTHNIYGTPLASKQVNNCIVSRTREEFWKLIDFAEGYNMGGKVSSIYRTPPSLLRFDGCIIGPFVRTSYCA